MDDIQKTMEAAFLAADQKAAQEQRRREFRHGIIRGLGLAPSAEALLIALDALSASHGFVDGIGNTFLDPSKEEIAETMGMSVDTARRAWRLAQRAGFLDVEEIPGRTSVFTILWPIMFATPPVPTAQGGGSRGSTRGSTRGGKRGLQLATRSNLPPPKNEAQGGWQQGVAAAAFMNDESMNIKIHESMNDESLKECRKGGRQKKTWSLGQLSVPCREINVTELNDPHAVDQLWELVLAHDVTCDLFRQPEDEPEDREVFFAFCHHVYRQRAKLIDPLGFFHHILRQGLKATRNQCDDEHDRSTARRWLKQLEGEDTPADDHAPALTEDFETRRRRFKLDLAQAERRGEL